MISLLAQDTYRIGVTGSRYWRKESLVLRALRHTVQEAEMLGLTPVLIHGGCPTGADWMADKIWRSWRWVPEVHPADWDSCGRGCPSKPHRKARLENDKHHPGTLADWCPGAGPRRNRHMISLGMDVLLAFPSGNNPYSGTRNCMLRAEKADIRVVPPEHWE